VVVLGCGSYRIGSSVEFDWCCVSALKTVRALGVKGIVINCNPETVSTDFDESDRLYFDELSEEVVTEISRFERPDGMIISVGGQTPNNLAIGLTAQGNMNILGTSVSSIDMAENRYKFSKLCDKLLIDQPEWAEFTTFEEACDFCARTDYPSLVRPSYVLSGAAMRVVSDANDLDNFLRRAAIVSRDYPVVISKYIAGAKEVEFDAVGNCGEIVNYAISEHVENGGVHSGDATLLLPAQRLYVETHRRIKRIAQKLCKALNITGPFNIQFLCKDNEVKVIECNLRASRTFPFISKTFNVNFIEIATRAMLKLPVRAENIHPIDIEFVGCKAAVFSFNRLKNSDPRLGVEMQSTGEVACYGMTQYEAFLKALISTGFKLPEKSIYISIGPFEQKLEFVNAAKNLVEMGYKLFASKNTAEFMKERGVSQIVTLFKPFVKREPNVKSYLLQGKIDLVICIPGSMDSMAATDGFEIRRGAIDSATMLLTNIKQATLLVESLARKALREKQGKKFWGIESWHAYHMIE
jgi:carbamoyl-phosphate synthase large subunit